MMTSSALFHVFRNTPFGRDTFLQSIHFAQKSQLPIRVYIPQHPQFLMYFTHHVVTVDLTKAFLNEPDSARSRVEAILAEHNLSASFWEPTEYTASSLPDVPVNQKMMCCPRSISDLSTKIGLGYIGPKVRQIINNASFPVLMPTPVFKEWNRVVIFFGGSENSTRALRIALSLTMRSGCPINIFTLAEGKSKQHFEELLEKNDLSSFLKKVDADWSFFEKGDFKEHLFNVSSDALAVVGAYGHGMLKNMIMGSKMEMLQSTLPNNLLIVGPNCQHMDDISG